MTNPTPTTREREAARDIANTFDGTLPRDQAEYLSQLIAAALARERREAWNEACACVCDLCRISVPEIHRGEWCHRVGKRDYRLCEAASIRAKMDTPATE